MTESILESLGWDIDTFDRAVGWILTDSRDVDFKESAVHGKGLRHKAEARAQGRRGEPDAASAERELYGEKFWLEVRPLDDRAEGGHRPGSDPRD